jgi:hypothetical protein
MSKRARREEEEDRLRREEFEASTFVPHPYRESVSYLMPIDAIASIRARLPTIQNGVSVAPSHIDNAGRGLFAQEAFQVGDLVTYYDGPIIRYRPVLPPELQSHARQLEFHRFTILGNYPPFNQARPGFGGAAFINDGRKLYAVNVEFIHLDSRRFAQTGSPFERIIAVRALRSIAVGDEIYVSYGPDYWRHAALDDMDTSLSITDADLLREDDWNAAIAAAAREEVASRANRRRVIPTPITCQICGSRQAILVAMADKPVFYCDSCRR